MVPETKLSISGSTSDSIYKTAKPKRPPVFPTISFYRKVIPIIIDASRTAGDGTWLEEQWLKRILQILENLERVGCSVEATGIDNVKGPGRPCVFIGNHMSTLETFVMPVFLLPIMPVTFIVKQSLVDYPVFGNIMRQCKPITVTRTDPRKDLKDVLEQGTEKLTKEGTSIIVFPQTTRSRTLDRGHFNSIGIKLARRAGVPVIPVALKTDAWDRGWPIKDLGRIRPGIPIHFAFGEPMEVTGNGRDQHEQVMRFITDKLGQWA
ncbi:MAG TPA: 1-acyl-sn-glycerol-3-phosphate acyltransferase [Nitrospirae bacterium]|nr:1-acyl-sn-glycerol-3-phosphate acyltransferase [Nitrospirota bacterium]